jgi:hypothetical protein
MDNSGQTRKPPDEFEFEIKKITIWTISKSNFSRTKSQEIKSENQKSFYLLNQTRLPKRKVSLMGDKLANGPYISAGWFRKTFPERTPIETPSTTIRRRPKIYGSPLGNIGTRLSVVLRLGRDSWSKRDKRQWFGILDHQNRNFVVANKKAFAVKLLQAKAFRMSRKQRNF